MPTTRNLQLQVTTKSGPMVSCSKTGNLWLFVVLTAGGLHRKVGSFCFLSPVIVSKLISAKTVPLAILVIAGT
jgi:hypothetical protein